MFRVNEVLLREGPGLGIIEKVTAQGDCNKHHQRHGGQMRHHCGPLGRMRCEAGRKKKRDAGLSLKTGKVAKIISLDIGGVELYLAHFRIKYMKVVHTELASQQ